ncbi:hypothetical protein FH972_015204 [Carpinus fangiana]|uniref:Uncharacterized protein n=1 Tax=Carpinus fangiana TaxID=176857 RepID=A0A5N6RD46_9ROSI|nr:hypothetical protein FH972_015204 [Carpinus fangiana]
MAEIKLSGFYGDQAMAEIKLSGFYIKKSNKLRALSQLNGVDDFSHWSDVLNNLGAGTGHMC